TSDCPTYIRETSGSNPMRDAGGERIVTRANPGVGEPPAAELTRAVTVIVPVAPPVTRPIESTLPSKWPPDWNQRIATSLRVCPAGPRADAESRIVSPT